MVKGERVKDWSTIYCDIANDLSKQGYNVFVSSHSEVRYQLMNSDQRVICIFPSLELRSEWIDRLTKRYNDTMKVKDLDTLIYVTEHYINDIKELLNDYNFKKIVIQDMNYKLIYLINAEV